ncbi:MAG: hypothetical protein LUE19_00200 [Clostridiales bacterium]|nr:hypothetical protein [Clostridiales bacterium]
MKVWKRILAVALVFCMLFSLTGCRYSDTLEQLIYKAVDEGFIDLDPPFEIAENHPENEDESDVLPDLTTEDDSERQSDPEEVGVVSEDAEEGSGYILQYDESGESLGAATDSGTTTDSSETTSTESTTAGSETSESGVDNQTGDGGEEAVAGNVDTDKQVVDEYGNQVTLEQSGTVAAVGELAVMVSMLGSGSCLLATDEETLALASSNSAFSDLSGATAVWSGDGSAGLDSDGLAQLIAIMPDIVIETSGDTCLSDSDVSALKAAGIDYQVVPELTSLSNIETVMTTLGTILGDRSAEGGSNAPALASAYVSWVETAISNVQNAVSGSDPMYTLYVSDWDADCTYSLTATDFTIMSGTGCAVIENWRCQTTQVITSLLSYASVTNTASKEYGLFATLYYTTPIRYSYGSWTVTGSKGYTQEAKSYYYLQGSYTVDLGDEDTDTVDYSLGLSNFPLVIAANSYVKSSIEASKAETYGQWTVYSHINNGDGTFNSDAFLDQNGNMVRTQISSDYEVVVNPSGFRSWTGGTCESVLEAVWAAWRIRGSISESDVRSYISDFYSTFYGYDLTSAEIDTILAGD